MHQEVFIETSWEDTVAAREARDRRVAELQAEGLICTTENLWNVQGYRVYLLVAVPDVPEVETHSRRERGGRSRSETETRRPVRRSPSSPHVEVR